MGYIICKVGLMAMQGRKDFTPKMLYQVHLDTLVPADNFYRQLDATLDFHFIYKETKNIMVPKDKKVLTQLCFSKSCWLAI